MSDVVTTSGGLHGPDDPDAPTATAPELDPTDAIDAAVDVDANGAGGPRVTEIGRPEDLDRGVHPVATALGVVALAIVVVLGLVGLTGGFGSSPDPGEVAEVVVPRLSGRPLADGQAELERLGLIVDVRFEPNELVPVDVIVDQTPVAGARLEVGERVVLSVSDGPVGVTVPDLTEVSAPEAVRLLSALGLTGVPEPVFDEVVPQNSIVGTVPAAGGRADPGSQVRILVSQGPEPRTVPELVGLPSTEAFAAIGRAELQVGKVTRRTVSDQPPGTVLSISPEAGAQVARDLPIAVEIARAPVPPEVPDLVGFTQASARRVADEQGFTTSVRTETVQPGDRRAGLVIKQSPIANSPLESGRAITITVGVAPPPPTTTTVAPGAAPSTTTSVPR